MESGVVGWWGIIANQQCIHNAVLLWRVGGWGGGEVIANQQCIHDAVLLWKVGGGVAGK